MIYLDLETTGLEKNDRVCAIGMIGVQDDEVSVHTELIKPPRKIRPEAMAVHHITNEMVSDKPLFDDAKSVAWLRKHNSIHNTLVAHNIGFDLAMLQKEGLIWQGGMIDTLKCTKHLIKECELYGLQYLRYELGLYKSEKAAAEQLQIPLNAHSAPSDALHVKLLHEYLRDMADDEKLYELTTERALILKFTFGKYSGRYIEEIAMCDRNYLEWMLGSMFDMDEDLRYSVEYFLKEVR